MRNKKRRYIWVSLLLAGSMGVSGNMSAWAGNTPDTVNQGEIEDLTEDVLSENDPDGMVSVSAPEWEDTLKTEQVTGIPEEAVSEEQSVSEDQTDMQPTPSDDSLLTEDPDQEGAVASGNEAEDTGETDKRLEDVVLPESVPFKMMALGEEKTTGMISSERFCIENKGLKDVCVAIQGSCTGRGAEEDYTMTASSTANESVQGKKNVWLYLRWEDENGKALEKEPIVIGNPSDPGRGEFFLKAPGKGEEVSRAYFSLVGDMRSETGEMWRDNELVLSLDVSVEQIESANDILE